MPQIKVLSPAGLLPKAGMYSPLVQQLLRLLRVPAAALPTPVTTDSAQTIWTNTLKLLDPQISARVYALHFAGSYGVEVDQGRLLICLNSQNSLDWVKGRLQPTVRRALKLAGYELEPIFTVREGQANE